MNPGKINIFKILCVLANQTGLELALFIRIRIGSIIPGIEHAAKSLPKTKELAKIHIISAHKTKIARFLVCLIPNTTGKVRNPAFLSPIRSSPSFNISLGRLIQNIKEAGKSEFFKLNANYFA